MNSNVLAFAFAFALCCDVASDSTCAAGAASAVTGATDAAQVLYRYMAGRYMGSEWLGLLQHT